MLSIRIADLTVELDNRYAYVGRLCRDYITTDAGPAFRVRISAEEIRAYIKSLGRPMTEPEAESHLLYRKICEQLPRYDALLLHAAVLEMDGRGYAFSARRGMGKTTHTALWQRHFSGRATVINGDKPIIRRAADGRLWAYGTPWCGKEGLQINCRCPLTALCFLEQAPENRITPTLIADAVARTLEATILPPTQELQDRMAALVGYLVRTTPTYTLACRPDTSAAELAYELLSQV